MTEPACLDPGALCTITAHGLNYPGRVLEVRLRVGGAAYLVEYVVEGHFHEREFFPDEVQEQSHD